MIDFGEGESMKSVASPETEVGVGVAFTPFQTCVIGIITANQATLYLPFLSLSLSLSLFRSLRSLCYVLLCVFLRRPRVGSQEALMVWNILTRKKKIDLRG